MIIMIIIIILIIVILPTVFTQQNIRMVGTLEMKVASDSSELNHDVELAANQEQHARHPHQLGMRTNNERSPIKATRSTE